MGFNNLTDKTVIFNKMFDIISNANGLLGIYANPGFGKTTILLQLMDC